MSDRQFPVDDGGQASKRVAVPVAGSNPAGDEGFTDKKFHDAVKRLEINKGPDLVLEVPAQNMLDRMAAILEIMKQFPIEIDKRKFIEAQWLYLCGHAPNAQEDFTRERIFWLMDDKSNFLRRSPLDRT